MFKGKLRILGFIIGGILLIVIIFGGGILLGWLWGSFQGGENDTTLSFLTVYTSQNDFRLVRVELHLTSAEVARYIREQHKEELALRMRRVLDQNFRTAGPGTFLPAGDALAPSPEMNEILRRASEAQIRALDEELSGRRDPIILTVTIYFFPD